MCKLRKTIHQNQGSPTRESSESKPLVYDTQQMRNPKEFAYFLTQRLQILGKAGHMKSTNSACGKRVPIPKTQDQQAQQTMLYKF